MEATPEVVDEIQCFLLDVGQGTANVILLGDGRAIVVSREGDQFSFLQRLDDLSFDEVLEQLAARAGVELALQREPEAERLSRSSAKWVSGFIDRAANKHAQRTYRARRRTEMLRAEHEPAEVQPEILTADSTPEELLEPLVELTHLAIRAVRTRHPSLAEHLSDDLHDSVQNAGQWPRRLRRAFKDALIEAAAERSETVQAESTEHILLDSIVAHLQSAPPGSPALSQFLDVINEFLDSRAG